MFDNKIHYALRIEESEGSVRFFASFKDGQATQREVEVSEDVYRTFQQFVKTERNLRRWDERHTERYERTEDAVNHLAKRKPKGVDDVVVENERNEILYRAISELPTIQRRRLLLHCEQGLTYAAIGRLEGCSACAVRESVGRARTKVIKKLSVYT